MFDYTNIGDFYRIIKLTFNYLQSILKMFNKIYKKWCDSNGIGSYQNLTLTSTKKLRGASIK